MRNFLWLALLFASWPDSKCQKTGVSFGQESVGQHGGGEDLQPGKRACAGGGRDGGDEAKFWKSIRGMSVLTFDEVDEGMAFFF